jgi:hypothetical protein
MKPYVYILFAALLFSACKKEDMTAEVTYSVHETSQAAPSYAIEYTSDEGGGTTLASNNDNAWASNKIILTKGQFAYLKVTCTEPEFTLSLNIFVNGNLWKSTSISNPTTTITLSGNVPSD